MPDPKILLLDIESAPLVGWAWGTGKYDRIIRVKEPWYILCCGYRWCGEAKTKMLALPDYSAGPYRPDDDKPLVRDLLGLFNEADILVAHNADRFDIPKVRARGIIHKLDTPSPYRTIDTLKLARKEFSFTSNRLDDVCDVLGLGRKQPTGGFDTWPACMEGDPAAWKQMTKYCASDVDLLVSLYERLRPWATRLPNLATISGRPSVCPRCGSDQGMVSRGTHSTNQLTWRHTWKCKSCGGYCSSRELTRTDTKYIL
jgi:hypothetical protein